jgi:hypothetical protein
MRRLGATILRTVTPNDRLLAAFRALSATDRQNRLMRIGDREIALAMMYMKEPDRASLLSHVGPEKVRRVRDELTLHERLSVRYDDYLVAVSHVRRNLESTGSRAVLGSYLRPRGRSGPR